MTQKQLATKIDAKIKSALDEICERRGIKLNRFIEEAILDKLEELEDLEDLKKLRGETFLDFKDVLKELKDSGKI